MHYTFYIILGVVAVVVLGLLARLAGTFGPMLRDALLMFRLAKEVPRTAEPKTVFGATSIYLPQVLRDFPDFHNNDAIAAVKTLVCEYLAIRYEGIPRFARSIVAEGLLSTIDRQPGHTVKNEIVHQVAMSRYIKTKECATITYQASVGYTLDGEPVEERYAVEYTLSLRDEYGEKQTLVCPQCGGVYTSTSQTVCAYCGAGIVRDTIKSWRFTSITLS